MATTIAHTLGWLVKWAVYTTGEIVVWSAKSVMTNFIAYSTYMMNMDLDNMLVHKEQEQDEPLEWEHEPTSYHAKNLKQLIEKIVRKYEPSDRREELIVSLRGIIKGIEQMEASCSSVSEIKTRALMGVSV